MVRPRIGEGRDFLLIRKVAPNISNKKKKVVADSRQGVIVQFLGLSEGLATLHRKVTACYETLHRASDLQWAVVNTVMKLQVP
jgi:hypothetical protein